MVRKGLVAFLVLIALGCAQPQPTRTVIITNPSEAKAIEQAPVVATLKKEAPVKEAKATDKAITEEILHRELVCELKDDQRSVVIEGQEPRGCAVLYKKFGAESKIAWSEIGRGHCERVRERVRSNLEAGGFSCKYPLEASQ